MGGHVQQALAGDGSGARASATTALSNAAEASRLASAGTGKCASSGAGYPAATYAATSSAFVSAAAANAVASACAGTSIAHLLLCSVC